MIRAVIDANVLVSGYLSDRGPSGRIAAAGQSRRFIPLLSEYLLAEISDVLGRDKFRRQRASRPTVPSYVATVRLAGEMVDDVGPVGIHVRDPDDEHLIDLAIAGGAAFLVTGDNDLLVLADDLRPHGVEVVTPARFLQILGEG